MFKLKFKLVSSFALFFFCFLNFTNYYISICNCSVIQAKFKQAILRGNVLSWSTRHLTLYPTGRSWQSCVHPLTLRFKHSFTLQFLSSDRSPQSSLPSQRFLSEMQRPLEHMKKEPLHKLPEKRAKHGPSLRLHFELEQAFKLTIDLDRLILFQESSPGCSTFCFALCL